MGQLIFCKPTVWQLIASNQFSWVATAVAWMPLANWAHNFPSAPSRSKGRPPKRSDQALALFALVYIFWWTQLVAGSPKLWPMVSYRVSICKVLWMYVMNKRFPMSCFFGIVMTRTGEENKTQYHAVRQSTTKYHSVLQSAPPYHHVLLRSLPQCITQCATNQVWVLRFARRKGSPVYGANRYELIETLNNLGNKIGLLCTEFHELIHLHHPLVSIRSHIFPIIPTFDSKELLIFACPIHCWASHGSSSNRLPMQHSTCPAFTRNANDVASKVPLLRSAGFSPRFHVAYLNQFSHTLTPNMLNFVPWILPANPAWSSKNASDHTSEVDIKFFHIGNTDAPGPSSKTSTWSHDGIEKVFSMRLRFSATHIIEFHGLVFLPGLSF